MQCYATLHTSMSALVVSACGLPPASLFNPRRVYTAGPADRGGPDDNYGDDCYER